MARTAYAIIIVILPLLLLLPSCDEANEPARTAGNDRTQSTLPHLYDSAHYAAMRPIRTPLDGGYGSPEELIDTMLAALERRDTATLERLLITEAEWDAIIYPEMGLHYPDARDKRPEIADLFAELHRGSTRKGMLRALRDYGGRSLRRTALTFAGASHDYISYTTREGTEIVVAPHDGDAPETLRFAGTIVAKDGRHKLLAFRDEGGRLGRE